MRSWSRPLLLLSTHRCLVPIRHLSTRCASTGPVKTAVVMMNMGGPQTQEEVGPFLDRLFSDREIIDIPRPLGFNIGKRIAQRRTPKIMEQYAEIGGGSPIRSWTEKQGKVIEKLLDESNPESAPHKAYTMFRYAPPLTEEVGCVFRGCHTCLCLSRLTTHHHPPIDTPRDGARWRHASRCVLAVPPVVLHDCGEQHEPPLARAQASGLGRSL